MGTSGVKFSVSKAKIIEALKLNKGKMTHTCEYLNCAYVTLQKVVKADPELIQLIDDLRHEMDCKLLDSAEDVLHHAMTLKESDIDAALKSSMYVLNNKGKERGYAGLDKTGTIGGNLEELRKAISDAQEYARAAIANKSQLEAESPVLDQGQPRKKNPVQPKLGAKDSLDELFSV